MESKQPAQKVISGEELVDYLIPKLHEAQIETLKHFDLSYNPVSAALMETCLTSHAVKAAIIAGMRKEEYLAAATLAYDASYASAEKLGVTQNMELARASVAAARLPLEIQNAEIGTDLPPV